MPATEEFVWTFCGDLSELGDEFIDKKKILTDMDVLYRHIPTHKNQFTFANSSTVPKNVILLMVSSVSQEHFFRSLPNTVEWLASLSQDPDYYVHGYDSYYTMEFDSLSNQLALYQGKPRKSSSPLQRENSDWIWRHFKEQGFITMFTEEDCSESSFINRYFPNQRNTMNTSLGIKNIFTSMVDDSFSLYCEPELRNPQGNNYFWKFGASCINNKPIHRITMDYLAQFLQNHKDQKKFAHVVFKQGVEPTMQRLQLMDSDFTSLLEQLRQFNYLKDSIVFILSEQGSVDTPYYQTHEGKIEHRKPFLFVLTQRDVFFRHPTYMMNLVKNRDNMVTALDIYQTLKTLAGIHKSPTTQVTQPPYQPKSNYGFSLTQEMPMSRTCGQSHINKKLCKCSRTPVFYLLLLLPLPGLILCWWVFTWCVKGIKRPLKTVPVNNIQIN